MLTFPVAGPVTFADTYGAPRSGGRTHEGADIFAPADTPVLAVDAGRVRYAEDGLGGHVAHLVASDGTRYYYAHLSRFEGVARRVVAGETIGYVGTSGNASHSSPHLHFEIHPDGGTAVDPFGELTMANDTIKDAVRRAKGGLDRFQPAGVSAGSQRRILFFLLLYAAQRGLRR